LIFNNAGAEGAAVELMLYLIFSERSSINFTASCKVKLSVHKTNPLFKIAPSPAASGQCAKAIGVNKI